MTGNLELIAKGKRNNATPPPTVAQHCIEVFEMATVIWDRIEGPLANAMALSADELRARVMPLYFAAAVLHDFMKANSAFQQLLEPHGERRTQPVRHEILAAVQLSQHNDLRRWLTTGLSNEQLWALVWVIGGHHFQMRRKREHERDDPLYRTRNTPKRVTLYLGHYQVRQILEETRRILSASGIMLAAPPELVDSPALDPLDDTPDGLEESVSRLVRDSEREWKRWKRDPHKSSVVRDLALLKVLLIAADVAGSALPRSDKNASEWITISLGRVLQTDHLQRIVDANLAGRPARQFQADVAVSENRVTVITAGCGNGKTTAAYMWAKKWAVGRKLFFTYPTTGTASAGFRDYLFPQTGLERDLIHGRASVDLQTMWESTDVPPIERAQRLESINAWGQQVIACTVDSVLGLIQNQRRPVFSFPAIVQGAFVFDEIHSYDRRLFSELLRFLQTFPGVPVLVMSASIPPERLKLLQRAADGRINQTPIQGDQDLERVQRYRLQQATEEECWQTVQDLLAANGWQNAHKVLWVCNTVGDAAKAYERARKAFPSAEVLLYHSRYRYRDRVELQNAVIGEFKYSDDQKTIRKEQRPAIAVTTQVCEMSLDISADLLVSAMCPLPSLVQRLGRLNRYTKVDDCRWALCYPFSGRPYDECEAPAHVEATANMIAELADQPCSQTKLSEYIDRLQSHEELPEYSAWLDGGWQSEPLPAREGDNSITVVRQEDLANVRRLTNDSFDKNEIVPLTIPMLYQPGFDFEDRAAGFPIAPLETVTYDWDEHTKQGKGAEWRRKR